MGEELDLLDKKLLSLLDRDSSLSTSHLAKILKQGRDRIEYRMEKLVEKGIISNFTAVINPHQLGGSIYKIYLKIFLDDKKKKIFFNRLHLHSRVFWIAESDGRWNVMFSIVAIDPIDFHQFQEELLSPYRELIHEMEIYPIIVASFFSRKYLSVKWEGLVQWDIGGPIRRYPSDDVDKKIIFALNTDGRMKTTELARQLNTTPDIIHYRMKKLEAEKVIIGIRANLSLPVLGMTLYKTQLTLGVTDMEQEGSFLEYCRRCPNIIYIVKQIGRCPLEIEIEAENSSIYFRVLDEMQRLFPNFIRNTDTVLIRNETLKWVST